MEGRRKGRQKEMGERRGREEEGDRNEQKERKANERMRERAWVDAWRKERRRQGEGRKT